jgi:glyoxylase-like metal-dependent hydrolase (beta-lactamase superfamily II)
MQIKIQPMGSYQTNCYIVTVDGKDFIIDPGMNATEWVLKNVTNPVAILNTHGHFDHVWSNAEVKEALKIPIYCPKDDVFMLTDDPLGQGTPKSTPDYEGLSGDFLFQQSIGRWDFPASSGEDMVKSLEKAMKLEGDSTVYPGHGLSTTLKAEQRIMPYWITQVQNTL